MTPGEIPARRAAALERRGAGDRGCPAHLATMDLPPAPVGGHS